MRVRAHTHIMHARSRRLHKEVLTNRMKAGKHTALENVTVWKKGPSAGAMIYSSRFRQNVRKICMRAGKHTAWQNCDDMKKRGGVLWGIEQADEKGKVDKREMERETFKGQSNETIEDIDKEASG